MLNTTQLIKIHTLSRTCNDEELLELLNAWRGINNVLLTFHSNLKTEISPTANQDFLKWGDKSVNQLKQSSDIIYKIILQRTGDTHHENKKVCQMPVNPNEDPAGCGCGM